MKINSHITVSSTGGTLVFWLIAVCLFLIDPLLAQNNIMYVSPKISLKTNTLASAFEKEITKIIPAVKSKVGYITYTDTREGQKICYNKIRASAAKYLLKLDEIKDAGSGYQLDFSLSKIIDATPGSERLFEEEPIPWDNSTFIIRKNTEPSREINEILSDLNQEVLYYFQNKNFRSRIFINPQDFEPATEDYTTSFIDWLESEMNETEHTNRSKYIIYYDDKPYPPNAPFVLYGKFTPEDQKWSEVQFYLINDTKKQKSRAVRIYVEDFEYGNPEHADKYKQEVINKIYDLLGRID